MLNICAARAPQQSGSLRSQCSTSEPPLGKQGHGRYKTTAAATNDEPSTARERPFAISYCFPAHNCQSYHFSEPRCRYGRGLRPPRITRSGEDKKKKELWRVGENLDTSYWQAQPRLASAPEERGGRGGSCELFS